MKYYMDIVQIILTSTRHNWLFATYIIIATVYLSYTFNETLLLRKQTNVLWIKSCVRLI